MKLPHTRSVRANDHILQTPDSFVRSPLPGMRRAAAVVHVGPAAGARFAQYTVEFEPGGMLAPSEAQRFVFVLDGELEEPRKLSAGHYIYIPPAEDVDVRAATAARAMVMEVPRVSASPKPAMFSGEEASAPSKPFLGDDAIAVRTLVPDSPTYDFAVNTMTFQPGAHLPLVESHVMEYGVFLLQGGGIFRLGDKWHLVEAGDFIWIGPYCPQWFGALGKAPARYLIYKDWNRTPLDGL